LDEPPTFISSS